MQVKYLFLLSEQNQIIKNNENCSSNMILQLFPMESTQSRLWEI